MTTIYAYDTLWKATDLAALIQYMDTLLREGVHADVIVPAREIMDLNGRMCLSMPAVSDRLALYINKVATIFDRHTDDPLPRIAALVPAFSTRNGALLALFDGVAVTNIKCAAVAALVTRYCAVADASVLAVIGAGVQARMQIKAVCAVRPIREIRLYARRAEQLTAFAQEMQTELGDKIDVIMVDSADEAISGADVIGTTTASTEPIARFDRLKAGVHINAMGGHTRESREVPRDLLEAATVIVEDVPTAILEAGQLHLSALSLDLLAAQPAGALASQTTIFSSTGHAFLDLMTVSYLLRKMH